MPKKKEPGQIAYEEFFSGTSVEWKHGDEGTHAKFADIESAVLAANKPERPAGVWIVGDGYRYFIAPSSIDFICERNPDWWVRLTDGDCITVSDADARKLVELKGGTWPEKMGGEL